MGAYAELMLACDLKKEAPQEVINILSYLCTPFDQRPEFVVKPDHWFFQQADWLMIGGDPTGHLPGDNIAKLTRDVFTSLYRFTFRAKIRGGEDLIFSFVHWLAPYSYTEAFVGYTQSPQTTAEIDLLYFFDGEVYWDSVSYYEKPPEVRRFKIVKSADGNYYELLPVDFA